MVTLTPLDIQNKEFRRALRGYHEGDVDEFLDDVVRQYETLVRENVDLKEQVSRLNDRVAQYSNIEEVLKRTLVTAEAAAGDLRAAAQREAQAIVQEAKQLAEREIAAAKEQLDAAQGEVAAARKEYRSFLGRLKVELRTQLEDIEAVVANLDRAEPK